LLRNAVRYGAKLAPWAFCAFNLGM